MRRRPTRRAARLLAAGIVASTMAAALNASSPGVHRALSLAAATAAITPSAAAPAPAPPEGVAGLVEPDGALYTTAGSWPAVGRLAAPVVGWAPSPAGGAWEVASDGGVFSRGAARFHGSAGGLRLASPTVGMAATPSGAGYWLVAADGGVFAFGDARFAGSVGRLRLASPIVGMAPSGSGRGYWLLARDGGVFAFGDARFAGSASGRLGSGYAGSGGDGTGYYVAAGDGTLWRFRRGAEPARQVLAVPAAERASARVAAAESKALTVALSEVGKPYVYGASGPGAFDCSGLTRFAYAAAGLALPRNTTAQLAATTRVAPAAVRPGDLVFFYAGASHVGMYVGHGMMVDAPHSGAAVRVESMAWFGPVVAVGRPAV